MSGRRQKVTFTNDAVGDIIVPESIGELVEHRRLDFNSSVLGMSYLIRNYPRMLLRSNHSIIRKFVGLVDLLYSVLILASNWFSMTLYFLVFSFMVSANSDDRLAVQILKNTLYLFTFVFVFFQFAYGLSGRKPSDHKSFYRISSAFFGLSFISAIALFSEDVTRDLREVEFQIALFSLALTIFAANSIIASLFTRNLFTTLLNGMQFVFLFPTYAVVIPIYSICNLGDASWVSKNQTVRREGVDNYDQFRMKTLVTYGVSNAAVLYVFEMFNLKLIFAYWIVMFAVKFNGVRLIGTILYVFVQIVRKVIRYADKSPRATVVLRAIFLPLIPSTWTAVAHTAVFSPLFVAVSFATVTALYGLAVGTLIIYPLGFTFASIAALAARMFAKSDYEVVVSGSPRLKVVPRSFSLKEYNGSLKRLYKDSFTRRSIAYVLLLKPIVASLCLSLVSVFTFVILVPTNLFCELSVNLCFEDEIQKRVIVSSVLSVWVLCAISRASVAFQKWCAQRFLEDGADMPFTAIQKPTMKHIQLRTLSSA